MCDLIRVLIFIFFQDTQKGPSVTDQVKRVKEILKKKCKKASSGISFFEFVIDPDSFSNTVKNIFLTSFIVKENEATIYIKNDLPHIKPERHTKEEKRSKNALEQSQMILTITKKQWTELKELLDIKNKTIDLSDLQDRLGGKKK